MNIWFSQNNIFKFLTLFLTLSIVSNDICLWLSELCHSRKARKVISTLDVTRPRFLLNRKSPRSGRIGGVKVFRARKLRGIAIKLLAEVRSDCNVFGTIAIRCPQNPNYASPGFTNTSSLMYWTKIAIHCSRIMYIT